MGLRGINPLVFTTFVANQLDPALNIGARPLVRRSNTNDHGDGEGVADGREDQLRINQMDLAVPGVSSEDTPIDESLTQLDPSRLRQEVGQGQVVNLGRFLDLQS